MTSEKGISPLPVALIVGPYDPTGAAYLPADVLSGTQLGCHVLSVPTSLLVRDTATLEHVQALPEDIIDDQLRCLLEDTPIQAIKSGPIYSPELASILAQIGADYSDVPFVLQLNNLPEATLLEQGWPEDTFDAITNLVLPQTTLLIVDLSSLQQWQAEGLLAEQTPAVQQLLQAGADYILRTGGPVSDGQQTYQLYSHVDCLDFSVPHQPGLRQQDLDSLLSTAICSFLAQGIELAAAIEAGLSHMKQASQRHFQLGMGHRLLKRTGVEYDERT